MIVILSQLLWAVVLIFILLWRRRPTARFDSAESSASRALHLTFVVIGFALMWLGRDTYSAKPAITRMEMFTIAGFVLQSIATLFGLWARVTLGENFSSRVSTGVTQRLVVIGPYRMARHPMYASFMVAALGSAMIVGSFRAYVGFLFIAFAYLRKIGIEERALERRFGEEYRQYREYVPPLLPLKGIDAVAASQKEKREKQKQAEAAKNEERRKDENAAREDQKRSA
jgi:protein-S-isoprenylcysteine O-methyltransferase Ste14